MRSIFVYDAQQAPPVPGLLPAGASALLLRLGQGGDRAAARQRARAFLDLAGKTTAPPVFAQVAPVTSPELDADLDALICAGLEGVFLEDCESRADVQQLSARLAAREAAAALDAGAVKIVALAARTPAAVFGLGGYRGASRRLLGLAQDETALPGAGGGRAAARELLLLGAAAADVAAFAVASGTPADCVAARREGFSGLLVFTAEAIRTVEAAFEAP